MWWSMQVTGSVEIQGVKKKKADFHSLWEEWQHHNAEGEVYGVGGIVALFALHQTQVIGSFKQNPDILISNIKDAI